MNQSNILIFASGSGSNAEVIIRHFATHQKIHVVAVFTNNPQAGVFARAEKLNIPCFVFSNEDFLDGQTLNQKLKNINCSHIVLAGFLRKIPELLIQNFKIVNIHPALLPNYGGRGMYGMKVHEAVLAAGENESGITIHEVNQKYDEGTILFQAKCKVKADDTPNTIAERIHKLEHKHFPEQIEKWILQNDN